MGTAILRKYLIQYAWWILLSTLTSVIHNYLNLQLPLMLQVLVDDIVIQNKWEMLTPLFIRLVLIFFFAGVCSLFHTLIVQYIGTNVVYSIRGDMFRSLQEQSYRFYDRNRTGDIMSKATNDVNVSRQFLAVEFSNFMRSIITLLVILVLVFRINWQLSLIFLSVAPILAGLMIWYRKHMYPTYLKMATKNGSLTSTMQENITGVRVVKSFGREEHEYKKFQEENASFLKSNIEVIRLSTNYGPLQEYITMLGSIILLFLGGVFVLQGKMSVGEVVAFYVFFAFLYDPIRTIINIYGQFSQVEASLTRINSILENKSEIIEKESAITISDSFGEYSFEDVWFSYEEDTHYALKGISFKVNPGERIAILGATGSGKSTLINLIPRFYDPTKGKILYDGVDLKELKIDDYRRQIGVVSQDIFLFSRSIRENIAYGLGEKVKQEDIEKVAKIAAIHNFIITLPEGYKSKVGERGQTLSGGQKQRIAIARALLLNPRVLILDDSLSAVDIDTEAQIQKALDTLYTDRTTFVITQRISTVQNCNRIIVLDDGKILEIGTHDELYNQRGIYTKIYDTMYKAQTKEKERKVKATIEVETPFKDLAPSDALTVKGLYEQKYPDEQKRIKAEEKTLKKLEKAEEKTLKKLEKAQEKEEKKSIKDSTEEVGKLHHKTLRKEKYSAEDTKNIEKSVNNIEDSVDRIEQPTLSKQLKKKKGDDK